MLKVKDLMTKEPFTLRTGDSLLQARDLMHLRRIRHVPIVSGDDTFLGLVTHRDVLSATVSHLADMDAGTQREIDAGIPLGEIMREDVTRIESGQTVRKAAEILLKNKYGCLPVVDDDKLVGILTEADFLKLVITLMDALEKAQ